MYNVKKLNIVRLDKKVNNNWIMVFSGRNWNHKNLQQYVVNGTRVWYLPENKFKKLYRK